MPPLITYLWLAWASLPFIYSQLTWTPIYVDGNSQVDLWTHAAKGCSCPWNASDHRCACCVADGGCHCGKDAVNRCTQCGLEEHCSYMCNMTFVSTELQKHSGKTFGQIKSPSLEGPNFCWYKFAPGAFERVELQIYRLINVGRHNNGSCVGGYLQLTNDADLAFSKDFNQICGSNERYSPPVVLFSDDNAPTLLFQVAEKTRRSQFLAFFSFTPVNNSEGLGFQPKGGLRLQNTDCDWLYQDFSCAKAGPCVLASPNYPGIYPPNRQCKYHITTDSENTLVHISFKSLLLPQSRCDTDYVSIYHGSTTNSLLLTTLCGNHRKTLEYSGPNLLIKFSSGLQMSSYDYNGFLAILKFSEKTVTTEPSLILSPGTFERVTTPLHISNDTTVSSYDLTRCDIIFSGNNTRSGHFDTREHEWYPICRLIFKGHVADVVHISLINYRLKAPSCQSVIEIYDGYMEDKKNPLEQICSPQITQVHDSNYQNIDQKSFLSTGNVIVILLRRPTAPLQTNEAEFISGAFFFHDEQISGTMQPTGLCDVRYNGISSPLAGKIDNPGSQNIYSNVDGPLQCNQQFIPEANQSITIKILGFDQLPREPSCLTHCGDNGCRCVSSSSLKNVDHLLIINKEDLKVACLCGDFKADWLPVSVRSWSTLTLIYNLAHYTWNKKGFGFSASYFFNMDNICGHHVITLHSGEIFLKNATTPENLNHFYDQTCTWTLHSNVERQLELEISSKQNRPCTAWNITIHEYSPGAKDHHLGDLLYTFCSRESQKTYSLPWKLNTAIVRLRTLSRTLPQFKIKWKSQVIRSNTRYGAPTPAPKAISSTRMLKPHALSLLCVIFLLCKTRLANEFSGMFPVIATT